MRERLLTIPEIMLIAGTRAALGAGVGLLIAGMISDDARKGAGKALLAFGVLSTIPIAVHVIGKGALCKGAGWFAPRRRALSVGRASE